MRYMGGYSVWRLVFPSTLYVLIGDVEQCPVDTTLLKLRAEGYGSVGGHAEKAVFESFLLIVCFILQTEAEGR